MQRDAHSDSSAARVAVGPRGSLRWCLGESVSRWYSHREGSHGKYLEGIFSRKCAGEHRSIVDKGDVPAQLIQRVIESLGRSEGICGFSWLKMI